jgi:hypothetical protein
MANGVAVARFAPPSTPAAVPGSTPTGISTDPRASGDQTELKHAIGEAVAAAVIVFYQAIFDQQERGFLAPSTKTAGGDRIAKIAELQLDHEPGDDDFFRSAHEQGKCVLRRHFNADLFRQHEVDMALDAAIGSVFEIVNRVVRDERIFRAAWAN